MADTIWLNSKNLFVRDDKKRNYYLITVKGNKRIDLKEFRKKNETRPLSFASENDLLDLKSMAIKLILSRYNNLDKL